MVPPDHQSVQLDAVDGTPLQGSFTAAASAEQLTLFATHGTIGGYARGVPRWLRERLPGRGYSVLSLNRRDLGDNNECTTFETGLEDVLVGLDYLERRGHERVVILGHSKGTLYLPHPTVANDRRVAGIALLAAVADNRAAARDVLMPEHYAAHVARAEAHLQGGRGDEVMPWQSAFGPAIRLTPRGLLSYFGPASQAAPVEHIGAVRVPTLVMWCSTDVFTPGPSQDALVAAATRGGCPVRYEIIEDPDPTRPGHAGHAFKGSEHLAEERLVRWLADIGR